MPPERSSSYQRGRKANKIVDKVMKDLAGRKGFDSWWEDNSPQIQREIRRDLAQSVKEMLD